MRLHKLADITEWTRGRNWVREILEGAEGKKGFGGYGVWCGGLWFAINANHSPEARVKELKITAFFTRDALGEHGFVSKAGEKTESKPGKIAHRRRVGACPPPRTVGGKPRPHTIH